MIRLAHRVQLFSRRTAKVAAVAATMAAPTATGAQTYPSAHGPLRVVTVAKGLDHPWSLAFLPDGRMLVTERSGRLRFVDAAGMVSAPLGGVPEVAATGQGGLLDVVLAPDFATSRTLYLSYSEPGTLGGSGTAVARATLTTDGLEGVRTIFRQEPKGRGGLHFGSRIVVARDGNLFVTLGERGERDGAQDLGHHRGKVIRIRPDGSIPPDNPFVSRDGAKKEIWSYGHRNPQGAALHPVTGALWTAEHGAMGGDEVNIPKPGKNYGWPVITYGRDYSGASIGEGTTKAGLEQPAHHWDPSIATSGMAFSTGEKFPAWKGNLFVGSLKFGQLARLTLDGERIVGEERLLAGFGDRVRDVRQGPDGYLYFVTDESNGRILRVEPAAR